MRILTHIMVLFVLLGTLLGGGCRRGPGVTESRLIALDSLIGTSPDSALALLQAVDTAALSEADRAYLDLLTTQATKKTYTPITDSTAICRAWRYYAGHGPADRRIRAMRYRAAAAKDLGDLEEAMRWYKRCELAARDEGDNYHAGYALMSMGLLYQSNADIRKAITKYRAADSLLMGTDDKCALYCRQQLARLYLSDSAHIDSAQYFINLVMKVAETENDTTNLAYALTWQASKYFYEPDYAHAGPYAADAIRRLGGKLPARCWHYASLSYAKMGKADSAAYFITHAPAPATAEDSSFHFNAMSLVCELKGDWFHAHRLEMQSDSIAESLVRQKMDNALSFDEKAVENEAAIDHEKGNMSLVCLFLIVAGLVCAALAARLLLTAIKHRHARADIAHLQQLVSQLESESQRKDEIIRQHASEPKDMPTPERGETSDGSPVDIEFLQMLYSRLQSTLDSVINSLGGIAEEYYHNGKNANVFMKEFHKRFDETWNDEHLWEQMETHINHTRANALSNLYKKHPDLTNREKHLLMLTALKFSPAAIAVCLNYGTKKSTSSMRGKLKKRLGINCSVDAYLDTFRDPQ